MAIRTGLTFKLVVPLTLGMCTVLAVHFAITLQRERLLFEETKGHYGRILGQALAQRLADTWEITQGARANEMQQELDELGEHVSVRWIPPDAPPASSHLTATLNTLQRETLERGEALTVVHRQGDRETLHTFMPVPAPGKGIVVTIDAFADRDFYVQASVRRFVVSLLMVVAVNSLLALGLSSFLVSRPFSRLIVKARQVGSGDLNIPVEFARRDEIGELGREMDRMSQSLMEADSKVRAEEVARRKAEEELHHAERLATIGKLAAGIAHEVGTPLNVISGRAKRLERQRANDPELHKNVTIIRDQVDRVTQIVHQLLHFARRRKLSKTLVDAWELTRSTVAEVRPTVSPRVDLTLDLEEEVDTKIQIDGSQIRQVLSNLIINGAQAMPQGGQLSVGLSRRGASPPVGGAGTSGDYLCLSVADQGQGIAPDDVLHIFEPFFTTKDIGEGTGLGLAVSVGIVQDHGGWIDVETEVGKGTRFTVFLPLGET
jgi:two-component system NtrC family sensor kinase